MGEVRKDVRTVQVNYLCDCCQKGFMEAQELAITTYPLKYAHVCPKCGKTDYFFRRYPYIEYVPHNYVEGEF